MSFGTHAADPEALAAEVAELRARLDLYAARISFLTCLAVRAVAEGWTMRELEAELFRAAREPET